MKQETRNYIEQKLRTDKKFGLAFVVVFVIWMIFGFVSDWPKFAVFNAAVWGGLSLSSLTRMLHSSRILDLEEDEDQANEASPTDSGS